MTAPPDARLLVVGGFLSSAVAALHFATVFIGAPAYRYLGAGERMAIRDQRGDLGPAAMTLGLTLIFSIWAAYAFSGARLIGRLPLLQTGLVTIGSIYALRGLVLIPQAILLLNGAMPIAPRHLFFSLVSLLTGLAYLGGARQTWQDLARP